jgi:hypothetical protein
VVVVTATVGPATVFVGAGVSVGGTAVFAGAVVAVAAGGAGAAVRVGWTAVVGAGAGPVAPHAVSTTTRTIAKINTRMCFMIVIPLEEISVNAIHSGSTDRAIERDSQI